MESLIVTVCYVHVLRHFFKFPVDFIVEFHFRFSCSSSFFCFHLAGSIMLCKYELLKIKKYLLFVINIE